MGLFGPSKKERDMQIEIDRLRAQLSPQDRIIVDLQQQINELTNYKQSIEADCTSLQKEIENKKAEINTLGLKCTQLQTEIVNIESEIAIQDYGLYKPTYKFSNSDLYKDRLKAVRDNQKDMIKKGMACAGNMNWTVNGSSAQGKKMVKDMQKLLLRAFNVECDDIVNNVKISNFDRSKERINKVAEQISKLATVMSIYITPMYINLKLEELCLALDFEQKKQEEKERIKEARERQREEAKIQKEIEEQRKKLLKERTHYQNALAVINEQLQQHPNDIDLITKQRELQSNISDTAKAIADVDYREANKRAGYVYIISNIGAFGKDIYKIGMTRRLQPQDRIDELSSASVPFNFDVHAMIFSEDAPALEAALHHAFEDKKINKINSRREFFRVSLNEIKTEVRKNFDKTVEWVDFPEAEQFRQSVLQGGSAKIQDVTNDVVTVQQSQNKISISPNPLIPQSQKQQIQSVQQHIPQHTIPIATQIQYPQIPDHYCICCKRSGKFMKINEEFFCPMCADTATEEQKLNAKREAGLI